MVQPSDFFDDAPAATAPIVHTGPLWRWKSAKSDAPAAWFFVTIDDAAHDAIAAASGVRRGFGSVRVEARVGETAWRTSVFPAGDAGGYLLPVKAAVRKAEGLSEGDPVRVALVLL